MHTAATRQYSANQLSLAFLTRAIITLQAKRPDTKADTKPRTRGRTPTEEDPNSPPTTSRNVSPRIGTSTMRKENCAMTSLFTPQIRPVEMVVPERERPGTTAKACPRPTANACQYDSPFLYPFAGNIDLRPGLEA